MNITKQLFTQARPAMIVAMLASAISAVAGIAIIAGINSAVKIGLADLNATIIIYIGLLSVLLISSIYSQVALVKIGYNMVYRIRQTLVNRLLNTSIEHQEQLGAPLIYNVLTRDVTTVANATRQLPVAIYNSFLIVVGISYLCWLSPLLFAFVSVVILIGVWSNNKLSGKLAVMLSKVRKLDDELFCQYEAMVQGRNELALNPNRRRFLVQQQFEPTAQRSRVQSTNAEVLWAVNLNWTTLLVFTLIGVIFYLGATLESVTQETVIGYILAIMFLRTPLSMVLDSVPAILRGNVAMKAINRLQLNENEQPHRDQLYGVEPFKSLSLQQAVYQYPSENDESGFILGPVDFAVNAGELIFIVGGNGSGKSTLAKLLTGLYLPTSGEVKLNGKSITKHNVDSLRHCCSAIFANFFLFTDVIDEQGDNAKDDKVTHYLKRLAIEHKVSVSNGKLSTTSLSQGQKKRLALLLVYMENRQILLLDEWAADQDPVFREVFYRQILPELKRAGKTIIAISHDDHYFDVADAIYKLDCGQMHTLNTQIVVGL
jgi:putative ATP-binding cassette transporter